MFVDIGFLWYELEIDYWIVSGELFGLFFYGKECCWLVREIEGVLK